MRRGFLLKIEVEQLNSNNPIKAKDKGLISLSIISFITIIILFFESICILIKGLRRGVIKKEILSTESKLGFDLEIRVKS